MSAERILFVTGRLAEPALRRRLGDLASKVGFEYEVTVLGISVAALMHVDWVRRKLTVPEGIDRVMLPGWCDGDLTALEETFHVPFVRGPKSLYDLPDHFGRPGEPPDLSRYDIEILAEINHAPRLDDATILQMAREYRDAGADVIDVGCIPGESWSRVGRVVGLLVAEGFRVSIDSFERTEVEAAVSAGAELVLSCNGSNLEWATALDAELVAIPDDPRDFESLERTVEALTDRRARFRIDPILEPIGFGFAASLDRYRRARERWPHEEILCGIGNVTELTEVDTSGVNVLLAAVCQELGIRSVLTTQVVHWARTAVREFDLARRLVHHALERGVLPKHLDTSLVTLRGGKPTATDAETVRNLVAGVRDGNFRIVVAEGEMHVFNRDGHWHGEDPHLLLERLHAEGPPLDASHASYLGYELCKAHTALQLGKRYTQDEALDWGFLTVAETSLVDRRRNADGDGGGS